MIENEKENVKLTVIIVSYNEVNYLSQAIDSCLNQKCNYLYEIVIGDDGSSDGSIDLIKEYGKKYPKIIKHFVMNRDDIVDYIPSIRVSNLIKKAAQIANGEYCVILSGDDFFCDLHKFQIQIDLLEENKTDGYVACYSGYEKYWSEKEKTVVTKTNNYNCNRNYWGIEYYHISTFIFQRKVFNSLYLLKSLCDDTGLEYSLACLGKWIFVPEVTLSYRQRPKSIMSNADNLELALLELLLFQECYNVGKMRNSTYSRFYIPFRTCYYNRKKIRCSKYCKYIDLAIANNYSFILDLYHYRERNLKKRINMFFMLAKMYFWNLYFRVNHFFIGGQ